MAEFHFVEDYEAHVEELLGKYPIDEAMSLAVGGKFREIGEIELAVLRYAGLSDGANVVDLGCGSGRLAHVLGEFGTFSYLGTDVVQPLLDYARSKCPDSYEFRLHRELSIPASDGTTDMVCAFSVFTHLLHEESFIYLQDIHRVLKVGGKLVFSFLEFRHDLHWGTFSSTVNARRSSKRAPLNMFIERGAIESWARHLSYDVIEIIGGRAAPHGGQPLGQSIAILRKAEPVLPPDFDPAAYLLANPDVARAGVDPVTHYVTFGYRESRRLRPAG